MIDEGVRAVVPDHLDRDLKLGVGGFAGIIYGDLAGTHAGCRLFKDARVERVHLIPMIDGVQPAKCGDNLVRFRVGQGRIKRLDDGKAHAALAGSRTAAYLADVAGNSRKKEDGASRVLSVCVTLRAPSLSDRARLGAGNLACKAANLHRGNTCDVCCPLGSLLNAVFSLAFDVGAVGGVLGSPIGHMVLIEAHAVLIEEILIVQILVQHDVDHSGDECSVRSRP